MPAEAAVVNGDARAAKRCRLELAERVPVLGREEYLAKLTKVMEPMVKVAAMYNSLAGGVVTDPALMALPIHDHAIVRGHACFDTCTVANGRLYRLDIHLDRHVASASRARIPLPFGNGDPEECKKKMRDTVAQTVIASGLREASVRYYTSVGPGNFGIVPAGCTSAFYVVVVPAAPMAAASAAAVQPLGIREYTVDVPLKPQLLATTKSNNYMLNALTAMASQDKGGHFGILVDPDGCIAESCVMNALFITRDRRLVTPPFDNILAGTTVRKLMQLARDKLVPEGVLTAVSQEPLPKAVAKECVEMMLAGGDVHFYPITHWDDLPVGTGEVGPVAKRLVQLLHEDIAAGGEEDHYELAYA